MNAARLRNLIETAAKRPTAARLAKALDAAAASELLSAAERSELVEELTRNREMLADCGGVSWDGLDDCLQIAIAVERRSLVVELGKPSGEDRSRPFVARQNGREFRGEVFRGWSRLGGEGWMVSIPGVGMHSSHRSIEAAIRNGISLVAREG